MQNIKLLIAKGLIWSGVGQLIATAIRYLAILLFAWKLSPEEYGLVGIAMIYILAAELVGNLGVASTIVQSQEREEPVLSTAFWVNLGLFVLLAGASFFGAEYITAFLGDRRAAPLLRVLALALPIMALGVVPRALLQQELNFRTLASVDIAAQTAYGICGLLILGLGGGVWAVVGAVLAKYSAGSVAVLIKVSWRPRFVLRLDKLRPLVRFGIPAMGGDLLTRVFGNLDYFIIGRWLGAEPLGYYTFAFQLTITPIRRIIGMVRRVAFPALSRIKDDRELSYGYALQGLMYLLTSMFPLVIILITVAPRAIALVYGREWLPAAILMPILGLGGIFYLTDYLDAIFYARGRPEIRLWILTTRTLLFLIAALLFGVKAGTIGIAFSLLFALSISFVLALFILSHQFGVRPRELMSQLSLPVRSGLIASLPLAILLILPEDSLSLGRAAILATMVLLIYCAQALPILRAMVLGVRRLLP